MGFPSPAQDYVEHSLSLDQLCITKPAATYMMRADRCYLRAGIQQGAILVIDASAKAFDGSVVVVEYGGKFHLKRLQLLPEPSLTGLDYTGRRIPIDLTDMSEGAATRIFGVLTYCVNDMRTAEFDDTPYGLDD